MNSYQLRFTIVGICILTLLLSACDQAATPTATPEPSPTPLALLLPPAPTPTSAPSRPQRVGNLKLANAGENSMYSAVIDPVNGFAYFGTGTTPGLIVKV